VVTASKATFIIEETYLLQAEHISVSYVDLKKKWKYIPYSTNWLVFIIATKLVDFAERN